MRSIRSAVVLLILAIGLIACRPGAEPTPTLPFQFATLTPGGSDSAQLPSPTVIDSPTLAATTTPVPTITPTPGPTNTTRPVVVTATPRPAAQAVVSSPNGFLNVREGPGVAYKPPLGVYNNGAIAEIIGKQYDVNGELWWLVRFRAGSVNQGWIYADFTEATNIQNVPWASAPPLPTPVIVTPEPTPTAFAIIDSPGGFLSVRRGPGRVYDPPLGYFNNGGLGAYYRQTI